MTMIVADAQLGEKLLSVMETVQICDAQALLSGYKSNKVNWLCKHACEIGSI